MKWKFLGYRKKRWQRVTRLMARDGEDCTICEEGLDRALRDFDDPRYITFDHIVPRSRGGLDVERNLRLAHKLCNELRGNDPLMEEGEA